MARRDRLRAIASWHLSLLNRVRSLLQELMPDVLHWLGISRIDSLVSMSDMKYNAIINSGIQVVDRIPIPEDWKNLSVKSMFEALISMLLKSVFSIFSKLTVLKIVFRTSKRA